MRTNRRHFLLGLGLVLLGGCDMFRSHVRPDSPKPGFTPNAAPPKPEALVNYLQTNSKLVSSVQCNAIDITARQGIQQFGLDGMMVCQKPRNFRLKAKALGKPQVDMGSNPEEFWFWIGQNKPPYVFHCSYQDLETQPNIQLPFPFKPDMLIAALGLAEYEQGKNYDLKVTEKTWELIESTTSTSGKRLYKVIVFNRWITEPPKPQVLAHVLRDEKGVEICSAVITEVKKDQATGAVLPQRVELRWPQEKMEMTMRMRDIQSVQVDEKWGATLFSRQDLARGGYKGFDLARRREDTLGGYTQQGTGIQRTGGPMPGRGGWGQ